MNNTENKNQIQKICVSSLALGIVGLVFSSFLPVVSYACSIPGLVFAVTKKKKNYNCTAGLALNIIAISIAAINSLLGIIMTIKIFTKGKNKVSSKKN